MTILFLNLSLRKPWNFAVPDRLGNSCIHIQWTHRQMVTGQTCQQTIHIVARFLGEGRRQEIDISIFKNGIVSEKTLQPCSPRHRLGHSYLQIQGTYKVSDQWPSVVKPALSVRRGKVKEPSWSYLFFPILPFLSDFSAFSQFFPDFPCFSHFFLIFPSFPFFSDFSPLFPDFWQIFRC